MARTNAFTTADLIAFNSDAAVGISPTRIEGIGYDRGIREVLTKLVADRDAATAALKREREYILHLEAQVVGWTRDDVAVSAASAASHGRHAAPTATATPVNRTAGKSLTANVRKRLTDVSHRQGWIPATVIEAIESLPAGDQYAATGAVYAYDRGTPMGDRQAALWNDHIADRIVPVA